MLLLYVCNQGIVFYNLCNDGDAIMPNGSSSKVTGKGIIKMKMYDEFIQIVYDVRFVLDLRKNLISLSRLHSLL